MTDRLREIEERWKRATPGPWRLDEPMDPHDISVWAGEEDFLANLVEASMTEGLKYAPAFDVQRLADARAIASAPDDIAWLLGEVRRLREALKHYENTSCLCCHSRIAEKALGEK